MTSKTSTAEAYGYAPGEGRRVWIVGDTMTFKATAAQTGGA